MNTISLFTVPMYFMSLLMFLNSSNFFLMWIMMEVNMVCYIMLFFSFAFFSSKREIMISCLFYFMIQSLGSFMFLVHVYLSYLSLYFSDWVLFFSLSLKLGLFPLSYWLYNFSENLDLISFIFLISLQKIPLMILLFKCSSFLLMLILFLNLIFGSFFIFNSYGLIPLMVSSSIYSTYWIFFIYEINYFMFMFFFFLYIFSLIQMGSKINSTYMSSFYSFDTFMFMLFILFVLGLPPLSLFFFKFFLMSSLISNFFIFDFLLLFIFSFLAVLGYIKLLYKYFFYNFCCYLNNELFFMKMYSFTFTLAFFLIFLIF